MRASRSLSVAVLLLFIVLPASRAEEPRDLVVVEVAEREALAARNLPVIWRGASFYVAEWDGKTQEVAKGAGIAFTVIRENVKPEETFYLFEMHDGEEPPAAWAERILHRSGRKVVLAMEDEEAQFWAHEGIHPARIPRIPRGWADLSTLVPYDCSEKPIITGLLARTSQPQWLDWIEKLSGVESVTVGGVPRTIATRFSSSLFNGAANGKAYDFALQQAQTWRYQGARLEEDPYSGSGGQTWKNLVLTIPGQTAPQSEVLLTGHLDSIWGSGSSSTTAPGANDNGTGTATLFEAARILRQYRFERTVKIIFFTGEEQGLWGSEAYTADHPMGGILGVVNLDMFGWDSNADRCFEIHVGTLPQSADVGNCFRDSIGAYGTNLVHDYLTNDATDRSDHASFWNVGVGAIEIAENYFTNSYPGGCVGSDPNPWYHTDKDTIAQNMTPSYAYDIARTALATIAAMAIPIESCFSSAPVISATPGVASVDLSWTAVPGASAYRVYRSTQGCEGQWTEIAETAGTTFTDTGLTFPGAHQYHVEAVASDGFCVSPASNCASAVPTIYRAIATGASPSDTCSAGGSGSANGFAEPGEIVVLPVTLHNDGNAALGSITGALTTTTPGITILDSRASWPDLAPGISAASLPDHFRLHVAPTVPCGTIVDLDIALSYAQGGNPTAWTLHIGTTAESLRLDEGFGAGIPATWTVVDGGSGGGTAATWTHLNPGGRSIGAPFAAPWVIVDSDRAGSSATQNESLITPTINASSCAPFRLEFSNQFRWYSGSLNETADVDVSTDGGTNWTNVLRMQGGNDGYTTPNTKTVDLTSAVATNPANTRVRFRYHNGQYEWWWAVDNVKARCTSSVCAACAGAGAGTPGEAGTGSPLTVRRDSGDLVFAWGAPPASCGATGYSLYRGSLATLSSGAYDHGPALTCSTGADSFRLPLSDPRLGGADWFVVTANDGVEEGSYGRASGGMERPPASPACFSLQELAVCP